METIAIDVAIRLKPSERRTQELLPSFLSGGVRGGDPDRACGSRSFHVTGVASLRHLDRAGGSAAKAVGPVHVLHIGLWMHVTSGRDRAYHIGDGEHPRIVPLALEGRAEEG